MHLNQVEQYVLHTVMKRTGSVVVPEIIETMRPVYHTQDNFTTCILYNSLNADVIGVGMTKRRPGERNYTHIAINISFNRAIRDHIKRVTSMKNERLKDITVTVKNVTTTSP